MLIRPIHSMTPNKEAIGYAHHIKSDDIRPESCAVLRRRRRPKYRVVWADYSAEKHDDMGDDVRRGRVAHSSSLFVQHDRVVKRKTMNSCFKIWVNRHLISARPREGKKKKKGGGGYPMRTIRLRLRGRKEVWASMCRLSALRRCVWVTWGFAYREKD